jgi:hypothetical protein
MAAQVETLYGKSTLWDIYGWNYCKFLINKYSLFKIVGKSEAAPGYS